MSVAPPSPPLTWRYGSSSFCPFRLAFAPFSPAVNSLLTCQATPEQVGSLPSHKVRHVFSHWSTTRKRTRGQCPRSHEQTPLCSSRASKFHPQILEIWRGSGGLYSRIHLCPFFVFSFLKSSHFNSFPSLLFCLRLWYWVWAARWRSRKGCPASSGWPCTAAPLPLGPGPQLPAQWCWSEKVGRKHRQLWCQDSIEEKKKAYTSWLCEVYLTAYISVASCQSATFSSMFVRTKQALTLKYLGIKHG